MKIILRKNALKVGFELKMAEFLGNFCGILQLKLHKPRTPGPRGPVGFNPVTPSFEFSPEIPNPSEHVWAKKSNI